MFLCFYQKITLFCKMSQPRTHITSSAHKTTIFEHTKNYRVCSIYTQNVIKNFFKPLMKPVQKDHLLLCTMIIVGILPLGIASIFNSVTIITLLSFLGFFACILTYCYTKDYISKHQ